MLEEARRQSWHEHEDLTLEEVQKELADWGTSKGLASDWVPRAALRTGL